MLLAGLTLFVLASLLCGLAISAEMLVAARFLQGIGAAMSSAVVLGMVVALFPEPGERAKAMGVYAFVGAAGASIGTLLGGVLTDSVGWRWIFLINLPIGVVTVLLALRVVAADRPVARSGRPDVLGGLLVTAGLVLAVLTIVDESAALVRLGLGAAAVALLAGFVVRQRRAAEPLVRLRNLPLPRGIRGQCGAAAHGGGDARLPVHRAPCTCSGRSGTPRRRPGSRCCRSRCSSRWCRSSCPGG